MGIWAELIEFLFIFIVLALAVTGVFMLWWWHKKEI